jgi:hypothetical protein
MSLSVATPTGIGWWLIEIAYDVNAGGSQKEQRDIHCVLAVGVRDWF